MKNSPVKSLLNSGASLAVLAVVFGAEGALAGVLPHGGQYVAGTGSIHKAKGGVLTVDQSSSAGIIDWKSFSVGQKNGVVFDNGSGATLNRVTGGNLSAIAGSLHATGSFYLMNNTGVIVSGTGRVVTGGSFIASSGNIANDAFENNKLRIRNGNAAIINRGTIVSSGGVRLAGGDVRNTGSIQASRVGLRAGNALAIGGSITAQRKGGTGGAVIAHGRKVDVSGRIDVSAVAAHLSGGTVSILSRNTTTVSGMIKAEGGAHGNGGFIETSGEHVHIADGARISTLASHGASGMWLIDPQDFTIAPSGGDITGATLSAELAGGDITIQSSDGATSGNGDIFVEDAVTWSSSQTLTLDADHNLDIYAPITLTGAGGLTLRYADGDTGGSLSFGGLNSSGSVGHVSFTDIVGGTPQGALSVNDINYTLIGTMAALQAINGNDALVDSLDASSVTGWVPIGTDGAGNVSNGGLGFGGQFLGMGNTISNLTVNIGSNNYAGLFGYSTGTIRDIGMVGGSVTGGNYVGGLVGYLLYGTITGSYATGAVSGNSEIGGLAGYILGDSNVSVVNSHATGTVTGGTDVGGLVGFIDTGSVHTSYATGAVDNNGDIGGDNFGGLVGHMTGSAIVANTYATGAVTGVNHVGAFVGEGEGVTNIIDSYATGAATSSGRPALFVGDDVSVTLSNCYLDTETSGDVPNPVPGMTGLTTAQLTAALPAGFNSSVWGNVNNQTTPYLLALTDNPQTVHIGSDNTHTFSLLFTIAQLRNINAGDNSLQGNYALANSLDAATTAGWVPIGTDGAGNLLNSGHGFSGIFNGLGNKVSNLTINDATDADVGMFGLSTGTVSNVNLANAHVSGGTVTGALVGENDGTVSNDIASGSVAGGAISVTGGLVGNNTGTVTQSSATVAVSDVNNGQIGGLVGQNAGGTISQSWASGSVTGGDFDYAGGLVGGNNTGSISQSYATGPVATGANGFAGGLVGVNEATISESYSLGMATGGSGSTLGGFIGADGSTNGVTHSYWDTSTSGMSVGVGENYGNGGNVPHVTGKPTAQLQSALPSHFDSSVWGTDTGLFPYFLWQYASGAPQAVSGFAYTDHGVTGLSAGLVWLLIGGTAMGTVSTGANGYYYFLEAPGTISGTTVLTYLSGTGGVAFADDATGSVSGFDIDNNYLNETTAGSSYTTLASDLTSAIGGNSALQTSVSGLANQSIDYTGNATFTIDSAINLGNGTLALTANGAVNQSAAIGASKLLLLGSANYTLNNSGNAIATVAGHTTGSLGLTSDEALTVGSVQGTDGLYVGGGAGLATNGGAIAIRQLLTADAHHLTLTSAGAITESGVGAIHAASLTGSSHGAVTLNGANVITDLGTFASGKTFALADQHDLTVDGTVKAGSHTIDLKTVGSGHDIAVHGELKAASVDLTSAAAISENGNGYVAATRLTGTARGTVSLTSAKNNVVDLGAFSTGGNYAFAFTDRRALTVDGKVNAGRGTLSLATTGKKQNLAIASTITGGTVNLVTTGKATETSAAAIVAKLLNVRAATGIELTSANNKIKKIGTDATKRGPNKITL